MQEAFMGFSWYWCDICYRDWGKNHEKSQRNLKPVFLKHEAKQRFLWVRY